jgi:hypothetical protein
LTGVEAFLREKFADGKQVPQKEILEAAKTKGFTKTQLSAAQKKLGIETHGEFWRPPDFNEGPPDE